MVFFAVFVMLFFMACERKSHETSGFIELPQKGWAYNDTLSFFNGNHKYHNRVDSIDNYKLTICVDYSPSYRYKNLWVEVSGTDGLNKKEVHDTVFLEMSDSTERWLGTGIASNYQVLSNPIIRNLDLRKPIIIRHIMRTDTLRAINRVGIFVESIDQSRN